MCSSYVLTFNCIRLLRLYACKGFVSARMSLVCLVQYSLVLSDCIYFHFTEQINDDDDDDEEDTEETAK